MKNKNAYDKFIEALLSLRGDIRGDVLRIGQKNAKDGNCYLYLFKRVQKRDLNDPIYNLMIDENVLTNEMILK